MERVVFYPRRYWFEVVQMVARVWFAGALIFLGRGSDLQLMIGVASMMVFWGIIMRCWPYRSVYDNVLWAASIAHLFATLFVNPVPWFPL